MDTKHIYCKNQKCLQLIPEIVEDYRKQYFFQGSKKFSVLTVELSAIAEAVVLQTEWQIDREEMLLMLEMLVEAQKNRDYILISDILEGDLLPFLQKLQMCINEIEVMELPEFFERNLSMLQGKNKQLYCELMDAQGGKKEDGEKYRLEIAINGQATLRAKLPNRDYFMHSTINPEREAQILASAIVREGVKKYIVFGMGLGYHVMEILKRNSDNKVIVLENDIQVLLYALRYMDWSAYLGDERLEIIWHAEIPLLLKALQREKAEYEFFLHYPSLQRIQDEKIRETLEDFFVITSSMREQRKSLDENFSEMQEKNLSECSELKETFSGKKVVIVGAGPSVDDELEAMRRYRNEITILAVGHIARKLLKEGIEPDAVVITDPQEHMYGQIEGLETKQIPLFLLSTASAGILKYYKGPVYLVYQEGYKPAEEIAAHFNYPVFQTGGSVSTLALDIAIQFGAEKIILVGLDMAYTGNSSHAGGVGREITDVSGLREVESIDGMKVYTSRNLDIYRKWIERRISDEKEIPIYNTGHGARIHGTIEASLPEILQGRIK